MATNDNAGLFKLPKEVSTRLTDLKGDIDKAEKAIGVLRSLGMDTKDIEDKLAWSKQVRETLLKEFA